MSLQKIEINKIKIIENHRSNIQDSGLDEMMQSIKQYGVLQPIGVARDGNGGFLLRFGQRRMMACKKLGYKTIEAMVTDKQSDQKMALEGLTENIQRKDPSFAEYGRIVDKLRTKEKLTLPEIAVRIGLPLIKIQQIINVYEQLPEKFRDKVFFMNKGSDRKNRKGEISATVATKVIGVKRMHGLKNKDVDDILDAVANKGLDSLDMENVGSLIGSGMSAKDALEQQSLYGVFTVDVCIKHTDCVKLMEQYQLGNRSWLFKKAIYGEIPPLVKPPFVFTGQAMPKKLDKPPDNKEYGAIKSKLLAMEKLLTHAQRDALAGTNKVPLKDWTPEQCQQLMDIYNQVHKK